MDNVLKRRLIGASILIALAVIFLPMLLVGPEPELDDRRLREPLSEMPDDGREVRRIPLDPDLARVPPARVEAPSDPAFDEPTEAGDEAFDAPRVDEPVADAAEPRASTRALPEEIVLNPSASTPPPDAAPAPAPSEASAESPPAETADSTTVSPPAASDPAPVTGRPPQAGDGNWVVQVASFGSQESSQSTRERLEALGHPVITDEVVRGDTMLYRLRTGPYANRAAAETARGQIAATVAGVEPIVREVSDAALESTPGFAVQVGSFASEENAERETARLRNLGFEAFRQSEDASGREIWKVLVGTVADRAEADALRARLADEAGVEGLVVSHP